MEKTAFWLAIASLAVSLVSLSWHIVNAILIDRPRVRVVLWFRLQPDPATATAREVVGVEATNRGKRPVQVTSLYLAFGRRWRWWARLIPRRWRMRVFGASGFLLGPDDPGAARLPAKLDTGDPVVARYQRQRVEEAVTRFGRRGIYGVAETGLGNYESKWLRNLPPPIDPARHPLEFS